MWQFETFQIATFINRKTLSVILSSHYLTLAGNDFFYTIDHIR